MALGATGVVLLLILSTAYAIKNGRLSGFLEILVYGVSNDLSNNKFISWCYILSWFIFISGLILALLAN